MNSRHPSPAPFSGAAPLGSFAVVTLMILAGCHAGSPGSENPAPEEASSKAAEAAPVAVTVVPVENRTVERRISVVGTLEGFEHIVVTPKVEGRVRQVKVDVGDRVEAGAVLLELDPIDYQLAVDEAKRSLEHELSRLGLEEPPTSDFDIEQLPSVVRSRLLVENAVRQHDRQKQLAAKNATTDQALEQAETDLKVASASLQQARLDARSILAAVRHRQSLLSVAEQKLLETLVRAPNLAVAGAVNEQPQFVVAKRLTSVGEMVRAFPSTPVFELVVDDVLKLHVLVPERYIAQAVVGLKVELRVEAYPEEVFIGEVARINPTIDPANRSFDVEVHVPNSDHRLKHGGFAKAEVIVGRTETALTVPIEAITRFAGVTKVFRVRNKAAEEVLIEIGTQGSGWIEAVGDLNAGDMVVTSGQSRLANGMRVEVRDSAQRVAQQR